MRWNKDGTSTPTTVFEAAACRYAVRVMCQCGRHGTFNAHGLWWHFQQKGWNDELRVARSRFHCRYCLAAAGERRRPVRLDLVDEQKAHIELPLPPDREWKRALSRFR